jgi:hypothetical protein
MATQQRALSTARLASSMDTSIGSFSAMVLGGSSRPRSLGSSFPSVPAEPKSPSTSSWCWPLERFPARTTQTAFSAPPRSDSAKGSGNWLRCRVPRIGHFGNQRGLMLAASSTRRNVGQGAPHSTGERGHSRLGIVEGLANPYTKASSTFLAKQVGLPGIDRHPALQPKPGRSV